MKQTIFVLVIAALLASAGHGLAQGPMGVFAGPGSSRRVTITQGGAAVASLVLPADTFLMATYDNQREYRLSEVRWEFHGNVVLKAQPVATLPGQAQERTADEIFSNPPVVLTLSGVDVLVENVTP